MIKTPKSSRVNARSKNGSVTGTLIWNPSFGPRKTAAYQQAQKFVDSEVLRRCDPLTPLRGAQLIRSGLSATKIGDGLVNYNTPYARYQYYGKLMVGRAPKRLTNIPLTYNGTPQRGAKWFERMKIKDKNAILKGAGQIVGK